MSLRSRRRDDEPDPRDPTRAGYERSGQLHDPSRNVFLQFQDVRLTTVFLREPTSCGSVEEYARKTGITPDRILDEFAPRIADGTFDLEPVGDQLFLHTAPWGRPLPAGKPEVAPNLWELLRTRADTGEAYQLWKLLRSLETCGWQVELQASKIQFGMANLPVPPKLAVVLSNGLTVPCATYPAAARVSAPDGLLSLYEHAGARAVGIICDAGALEMMTTAVRKWVLHRMRSGVVPQLHVLVLESPRFDPVFLSPTDSSITPVAVSRRVPTFAHWDNGHSPS